MFPKSGGKVVFGKLLAICGLEWKSADTGFLSFVCARLLPARLACLGERFPLSLGGMLLLENQQLDLLLSVMQ